MPALEHRGIDLPVRRASGRGLLPGFACLPAYQRVGDHRPRVEKAWDHMFVEDRPGLAAVFAPSPRLLDRPLPRELPKSAPPPAVRGRAIAAASRAAPRAPFRWYARGGSVPGLRRRAGKPAPEAFPLGPESRSRPVHYRPLRPESASAGDRLRELGTAGCGQVSLGTAGCGQVSLGIAPCFLPNLVEGLSRCYGSCALHGDARASACRC